MAIAHPLDPRSSWPGFLVASGLGLTVLFTLLRPDISSGLTGIRLPAFWAAHVLIPLALLQLSQSLLSRQPLVAALNPWLQTTLSGLAASVLFAPLALILDQIFGLAEGDAPSQSYPAAVLDEFAGLAPIVTLVWLALNATRLLRLMTVPTAEPKAAPAALAEPAFWARVPGTIGRDLVALSAELHYLRVRTSAGEALVLYPFGKAVADLDLTGLGLQIHRSHWVATSKVTKVERRGQAGICTLSTGLSLPVSRQYRANLLGKV